MRHAWMALCGAVLVLGCSGDPVAPIPAAGDYRLARVGGGALPAMVPFVEGYATALHVTAGRLTLGPGGSFVLTLNADMFATATNTFASGDFVGTCRGTVEVAGAWLQLRPEASSGCRDAMEGLVDARTGRLSVSFAPNATMGFER